MEKERIYQSTNNPYFPYFRNEKYPKHVRVDFRRLKFGSLEKYAKLNDLNVRPDSTRDELAVAVALHFGCCKVDEDNAIRSFLKKCGVKSGISHKEFTGANYRNESGLTPTKHDRNKGAFSQFQDCRFISSTEYNEPPPKKRQKHLKRSGAGNSHDRRRPKPLSPVSSGSDADAGVPKRANKHARQNNVRSSENGRIDPGEQVAAKVDDNWILASVVRYNSEEGVYDVEDEDDTKTKIQVSANNLVKLGIEHDLEKDEKVYAIFPETTSFYHAELARPLRCSSGHFYPADAHVKFVDDVDLVTGKTPIRKVPARYVMAVPENERREPPPAEGSAADSNCEDSEELPEDHSEDNGDGFYGSSNARSGGKESPEEMT